MSDELTPIPPLNVPALAVGETLDSFLVVSDGMLRRATPEQVKLVLSPAAEAVPEVVFISPSPLSTSTVQVGATVNLQVRATDASGIASVQFSTPANANIGMGTLVGSYYQLAYTIPTGSSTLNLSAKATNTKGATAIASTFVIVSAALPKPPPPTFINFSDTRAGGSVQLVPATGVPMSEYVWKVGSAGTYQPVPSDGVITVGNVAGSVYMKSVGSATRSESEATSTPAFSVAAQVPTVEFVNPTSGSALTAGATIVIRLNVTDPLGQNISTVRIYNGSQPIGLATPSSPGMWEIPYTVPAALGVLNFRAEAVNEDDVAGNGACFVNVTAPSTTPGPTPATVPGAPTNAVGTAGNNTVSVNATAPGSNGGAAITGYNLYRNNSTTALATGVSLPYADNTAQNGTAYTYQVAAVNSVGVGAKSAASAAVTPAAPAPVSYDTTLTGPSQNDPNGVTLTTGGGADTLEYNTIANPSGTDPKLLNLSFGGTIEVAIDFLSAYLGQPLRYTRGGTVYNLTFTDGQQDL